jgi:hypothetical protein
MEVISPHHRAGLNELYLHTPGSWVRRLNECIFCQRTSSATAIRQCTVRACNVLFKLDTQILERLVWYNHTFVVNDEDNHFQPYIALYSHVMIPLQVTGSYRFQGSSYYSRQSTYSHQMYLPATFQERNVARKHMSYLLCPKNVKACTQQLHSSPEI